MTAKKQPRKKSSARKVNLNPINKTLKWEWHEKFYFGTNGERDIFIILIGNTVIYIHRFSHVFYRKNKVFLTDHKKERLNIEWINFHSINSAVEEVNRVLCQYLSEDIICKPLSKKAIIEKILSLKDKYGQPPFKEQVLNFINAIQGNTNEMGIVNMKLMQQNKTLSDKVAKLKKAIKLLNQVKRK